MTTMYSAVTYAQVQPNGPIVRPTIPSTATVVAFPSPTWNPYSALPADRTEYWEDPLGGLTKDDVLLAVYGLAGVQKMQISTLTESCQSAIVAGFSSDALGSAYNYPNKAIDQQNLSASILSAIIAKSQAITWATSASVTAGETLLVSGETYIATAAGTTGTTAPVTPTAPSTTITDGTVTWERWTTPFWCEDSNNNWAMVPHTANEIIKVGTDGKTFVLLQQQKLNTYSSQVMAATSVASVQSIVWA